MIANGALGHKLYLEYLNLKLWLHNLQYVAWDNIEHY